MQNLKASPSLPPSIPASPLVHAAAVAIFYDHHRGLRRGCSPRHQPTAPTNRIRIDTYDAFQSAQLSSRSAVPYWFDHGAVFTPRSSVGSRTGAPAPSEIPRPCRLHPATANAAFRFPALRSPICFMSRLMRPILLGRLSALPTPSFPAEALSLLSIRTYRPRNARTVQPSP